MSDDGWGDDSIAAPGKAGGKGKGGGDNKCGNCRQEVTIVLDQLAILLFFSYFLNFIQLLSSPQPLLKFVVPSPPVTLSSLLPCHVALLPEDQHCSNCTVL